MSSQAHRTGGNDGVRRTAARSLFVRLELRAKIAILAVLVTVSTVTALDVALAYSAHRLIEDAHQSQARAIARTLAGAVALAPEGELPRYVRVLQQKLEASGDISGIRYIYIQDAEGSILAHTFKPHFPANFEETNWIDAAGLHDSHAARQRDVEIELGGEIIRATDVAVPAVGSEYGVVHVGIDRTSVDEQVNELRLQHLLVGFIVTVLGAALSVLLLSRVILHPLNELNRVVREFVASGDLTRDIAVSSEDQVGELAASIQAMLVKLRDVPREIQGSASELSTVSGRLGEAGELVENVADQITTKVVKATRSMDALGVALADVARGVAAVERVATHSGTVLGELAASGKHVTEAVAQLQRFGDNVSESLHDSGAALRVFAESVRTASSSLTSASGSMETMQASIGDVDVRARMTSDLSARAAQDASRGLEAVAATIDGIYAVERSASAAAKILIDLQNRAGQILPVVDLIDDIAQQASLLALNAAILAAQSGEHDAGFGVVAREIKNMAERTRGSTNEVAHLVGQLRGGVADAVAVTERSLRDVNEAVARGGAASAALNTILQSVNEARANVDRMSAVLGRHSESSSAFLGSVGEIMRGLGSMQAQSASLAKRAEQTAANGEKMEHLARGVHDVATQQLARMDELTKAVQDLVATIAELRAVKVRQGTEAEQVADAMQAIEGVLGTQAAAVQEVQRAIAALRAQSAALNRQVAGFRVS